MIYKSFHCLQWSTRYLKHAVNRTRHYRLGMKVDAFVNLNSKVY